MSDQHLNPLSGIEQQTIDSFAETAYLNYSMYVIMDRALPHIGDGLKPVQRRIIYAMSELGLSATAKYKKSARTVGDVLGKFHPHGDSACYEAMVLMAQPFSYRYPLVDGQGNWGAADDPKSFAAMRYTESRLAAFSQVLLSEVKQGTVDWALNFDGTLQEPKVLPARLPHILLNGITGIAVGMATDIPPHHCGEIADACIALLQTPELDFTELRKIIPGPDYPTAAEIITSARELDQLYQQGKGSIRARAVYQKEQGDIVITAIPHQTSSSKILEQIAQQMQAKKLPMIIDLRDESDHENPTRLVLVPRSNRIEVDAVMQHLFATTDLEKSYRVNFNIIGIDGRPQVKSLKNILNEWLVFRRQVTTKRLEYRLAQVQDRLHVLEGLLIAFLNIDEVIRIIRQADEPKIELMNHFDLSERQAEAILELRLRQIAKLEEIKIVTEQQHLAKEQAQLMYWLGSTAALTELMITELERTKAEFVDERRSPLVQREEAKALQEKDLMPNETITVILSQKGWARCAKGHDIIAEQLHYKSGDALQAVAEGKSNQVLAVFDSSGKVFCCEPYTLPSARSQGEPLTRRFGISHDASFQYLLLGDLEEEKYCLLVSSFGYGFIAPFKQISSKNKTGKGIVNLAEGAELLAPCWVNNIEDDHCYVISSEGRLLIFMLNLLPKLSKGKGNKMIDIAASRLKSKDEYVLHTGVIPVDHGMILYAGKRKLTLKPSELEHYISDRGRRGNKLPRGLQKVDRVELIKA